MFSGYPWQQYQHHLGELILQLFTGAIGCPAANGMPYGHHRMLRRPLARTPNRTMPIVGMTPTHAEHNYSRYI